MGGAGAARGGRRGERPGRPGSSGPAFPGSRGPGPRSRLDAGRAEVGRAGPRALPALRPGPPGRPPPPRPCRPAGRKFTWCSGLNSQRGGAPLCRALPPRSAHSPPGPARRSRVPLGVQSCQKTGTCVGAPERDTPASRGRGVACSLLLGASETQCRRTGNGFGGPATQVYPRIFAPNTCTPCPAPRKSLGGVCARKGSWYPVLPGILRVFFQGGWGGSPSRGEHPPPPPPPPKQRHSLSRVQATTAGSRRNEQV